MKKLLYILIVILQPLISEGAGYQDQLSDIRGKVMDTGSAPLTGASVTIENSNLGVHSDSE
jgi:hypothetical protein